MYIYININDTIKVAVKAKVFEIRFESKLNKAQK